ncbi:hypothetical protein Ptr902_02718 [Pyrenophora tritici-repentis]|nr:hypothetical protein Ptr902_02718 [Pyrenophora tritici-repentis]
MISSTIKDASQNPEEKARLISPEIKQTVGEKLRSQHAPIAEQFTRIALDHIKRWLRGNTSTRDLGDGAKAEIAEQVGDLVKGLGSLFGSKKSGHEESSRGIDEANRDGEVHREVRLEFRKVLGEIEKQLFELLPDQFQRPLEKIFGGNPFDSQLDRDASGPADRGFGDDIKAKLLGKIRDLVRKVQETLRESILGVVNGGHRKFERESWVFVQAMVEQKVQRYLPDVKINVPDDIGNENVSVGDPTSNSQHMGGGQSQQQHTAPPPQQGYDEPPRYQNNQQYQSQDYRPEHHAPQQGYPPQDYNRQDQYAPPPQSYHQQAPPEYRSSEQQQYPPPPQQGYQQHGSGQPGYPPREYREGEYRRQDY